MMWAVTHEVRMRYLMLISKAVSQPSYSLSQHQANIEEPLLCDHVKSFYEEHRQLVRKLILNDLEY